MSKAEQYRDLVEDVFAAVVSGEKAASAIIRIAWEEDLDAGVLDSWVKRSFATHGDLEESADKRREAALAQAAEFAPLADIIEAMPPEALASKSIPQFTPWHKWIYANCWEEEGARRRALDFAHIQLGRRKLQCGLTHADRIEAPSQNGAAE